MVEFLLDHRFSQVFISFFMISGRPSLFFYRIFFFLFYASCKFIFYSSFPSPCFYIFFCLNLFFSNSCSCILLYHTFCFCNPYSNFCSSVGTYNVLSLFYLLLFLLFTPFFFFSFYTFLALFPRPFSITSALSLFHTLSCDCCSCLSLCIFLTSPSAFSSFPTQMFQSLTSFFLSFSRSLGLYLSYPLMSFPFSSYIFLLPSYYIFL